MTTDPRDKRQRYLARWNALRSERASWDSVWREIAVFIKPRLARFFAADTNKGTKKEQAIINAAATHALDVMAAGILAGVTSPARPWLRITVEDPDLAAWDPAKNWLDLLSMRTLAMLSRTNLYNTLHGTYQGLGGFGTDTFLLEEDAKSVLWAYPQPLGEYALALDERLEVDTLFRAPRLTVRMMVRKFGLNSVSKSVREHYEHGRYDTWIDVLRVVEPREEYNPNRQDGLNKPWSSCWLELAGEGDRREAVGTLRESGFDDCPIIAPRWDVLGEDVYGTGPGHVVLGDTKALQLYEKRKAQAVERIVDPPMLAASGLRGLPLLLKPGGVTYADPVQGRIPALAPVFSVPPQVVEVANLSVRDHVQRIREILGADLWLMAADSGDPQKTAREIAERHEEKLLQLGPVMERLDNEALDKIVTRAISVQLRRGLLPKPPRELHGQQIKLEYQSIMAQAQRMVVGAGLQQFSGFVQQVSGYKPDAGLKVNSDQMIAGMAEALGVPPKMLNSDAQVQAARQQQAQAQAQQQQAEMNQAQAQHAKTLSETDTGGDNALTQLLGGVAGAQASGQG